MLANNRDSSSNQFTGKVLNWQQFESSLESLACACAAKAKAGGYMLLLLVITVNVLQPKIEILSNS